uniref:Uncharacterized protein n=1 Tax=Romanomermis culicivorax TaxID=13658 RepID=A0A915HW51_ROMCU
MLDRKRGCLVQVDSTASALINELKFFDLIGRIFALLTNNRLWTNKSADVNDRSRENRSSEKNDASEIPDILRHLNDFQQQLVTHFFFCNEINASKTANDIDYLNGLPKRSYFYEVYCTGSYFTVLTQFLTTTAEFLKNFHQTNDKRAQYTNSRELEAQIKSMFSNHQLKDNEKLFPYAQLAHVSFLVQTNSLILIILNLYNTYVLQRVTSLQSHVTSGDQQTKKSRKKKQQCSVNESDIFSTVITSDWKNSFYEICHMIFQSIDTTKRVVSDLELILETSLIDLISDECKIFSEMNLPSCSNGSNKELDVENFNNILTRTRRLIEDCTGRAESWKARAKEYEELKKSMEWISSETQHSVMVPFGSCAFMPGKMTHTNEILVLLGDNWFVERSTGQATDIVNRRIDYCNSMLKKIREERKLFTEKISALSDLNADLLAADGIEICEYIDDEVSENTVSESTLSTIVEEKNEEDEDPPASNNNDTSNTMTAKPNRVSESEYRTLMSHLDDLMRNEELKDEELRSNASSDDQNHLDSVSITKTIDLRKTDENFFSPGQIDSERFG